ncbi:MAG TPA: ATP-binding protein [Pyrinomonadaceae bacterium]|nr:ATP-binding protein [Pyrinomonadaceae bacterium]
MSNEPNGAGPLKPKRRRRVFLWTLGFVVLLLLAVIVSQQTWLWTVVQPDTASDTLLLYALSTLNFVAFVIFSFIFVRNLLKLRRERRERQLGSKIKTRLLFYFIAISFLPITAMAVFSYLFLNRSLEKWFSPFPQGVIQEARAVRKEALERQNRSLRETATLLAPMLNSQPQPERQRTLDEITGHGQFAAIEIVSSNGGVLAASRSQIPDEQKAELEELLRVVRANPTQIVESLADGKAFDVVAVPLSSSEVLVLAPARRPDTDLNDTIADSSSEHQKLVKRQRRVRLLGVSTLGLMTLILLFVSSWVAIYLARGIATPIKALAEASDEIARGNLSHRVDTMAEDELALLAHSFNEMTAQLQENRSRIDAGSAELRDKNLALEERRNYIETVLESLSTGVVSLDEEDRVTTINAAAARLLKLPAPPTTSQTLSELLGFDDHSKINQLLKRARRAGHASEQALLMGPAQNAGGPLPVALTATALRNSPREKRGVVLVIEDLSELLEAQRAAAWSEVARRMAHEIKNPLTPIQLSAERIAKSYRRLESNGNENGNSKTEDGLDESRVREIVDECTSTISREVAGLKAMVDEFSRFARLPVARLEVADLNGLIEQAVGLFEGRLGEVRLDLALAPALPPSMLDGEQMRRVFVNLIDNAFNALADVTGERYINISTSNERARGLLIAEVADNGHGIKPGDFKRLFQPYFSTRGSGTGLGLAIVQRIVLEHRGRIRAEMNYPRGARFVIELPAGAG